MEDHHALVPEMVDRHPQQRVTNRAGPVETTLVPACSATGSRPTFPPRQLLGVERREHRVGHVAVPVATRRRAGPVLDDLAAAAEAVYRSISARRFASSLKISGASFSAASGRRWASM